MSGAIESKREAAISAAKGSFDTIRSAVSRSEWGGKDKQTVLRVAAENGACLSKSTEEERSKKKGRRN